MRLIDADALIQAADKMFEHIDSPLLNHLTTYDVYSLINNAPTIEERPKGEWIYAYTNGFGNRVGFCSICENTCSPNNFCPNCGAKMTKEKNNE